MAFFSDFTVRTSGDLAITDELVGIKGSDSTDDNIRITVDELLTYLQANLSFGGAGTVDTANSPNAGEFARFTDADTIEGRTATETTADLIVMVGDSGAGGAKGLVPAQVAGDATKFLRGDATWQTISGGGDALTTNPLSQFAATTSLQLKGVISDETGSGALVFGTSPTITTGVFATSMTGSYLTASEILITDGSKNIVSAAVATYPSLTELAFVKGVTSAVQTQLDAKQASDADLTAIAGLAATAGMLARTGAGTFAVRTLAGTANQITATNGDGASAAPTFSIPTAFTLPGNMQLVEGGSVDFDAASSADGAYCGFCRTGTAGATLAFGDLVYLAAADSRWELTDADAVSTAGDVLIAICVLAAAADGDPTKLLFYGIIRADAKFPTLTIAAPAFISTSPGLIVSTFANAPSGTDDVIRKVGHGWTADELFFNPSNDYVTHT